MELKTLVIVFLVGLFAIGLVRFLFTPYPEKAEDTVFVENIIPNIATPFYYNVDGPTAVYIPFFPATTSPDSTIR
jgi:hypothetical protein